MGKKRKDLKMVRMCREAQGDWSKSLLGAGIWHRHAGWHQEIEKNLLIKIAKVHAMVWAGHAKIFS